MKGSRKVLSIATTAAVAAVFVGLWYYLLLPALTPASPGFWWFLTLAAATFAVVESIKFAISCGYLDDEEESFHGSLTFWSWVATGGLVVVITILAIISSNVWHAGSAYKVAEVEKAEISISEAFADLAEAENQMDLPLVDLNTAITLGDKKMAALENAPWYDVSDEYNLIKYQGRYYRLSEIDYAGLFKYNKANTAGIPGYVLVDCTPENGVVTQSATLVELEKPIRYSPGAYWGEDLMRHLRFQYPCYMFDSPFLEIDEEGTPYWITGVKRPTCGVWAVATVRSFILTNAQTGESAEFSVKEAPEWVDHVFSLDYLMEIADWHYSYRDGWWNAHFGQTGVWKTSYNYRSTRSSKEDGDFANFYGYSSTVVNGEVVFYTGLTASNKAESNLGWLTIDISTGKMTEYSVIGAEESSAQAAVEQLVAAQRYQATFPLPANIGGEASYIMCLKGNAGLVQGYAICNVENFSIAVQAATLPEAVDLYLAKLGQAPTDSSTPITTPSTTDADVLARPSVPLDMEHVVETYSVDINGTTQYYYVMEDGSLYCVVKIK